MGLLVACRCLICMAPLEESLEEFRDHLEAAEEEAIRRNSNRIPLVCPVCTQTILNKQASPTNK